MGTLQEKLDRLRRFNAQVREVDPELASEGADLGAGALESVFAPATDEQAVELESIIMRRERPVLAIKENEAQLVFVDQVDSQIWKQRLERAKPQLDHAVRAVGRVELKGSRLDWVGTGWLVADNILVTNRHVANEFAQRKGEGFTFRMGDEGPVSAAVDFLQEIDNQKTLVFQLVKPLHIEESPGPDVSFFEIEVIAGDEKLARPIELATRVAQTENVAAIGYPAYDSRIPEPDLMERIYGKVYNKKRLAPGGVTRVEETRILHNCTTLGGNSGSVLVDLESGQALGLHYSGSFLTTNYAVRADVVAALLARVRAGGPRTESSARPAPARGAGVTATVGTVQARADVLGSLTIPLTITVSVGDSSATAALPKIAPFAAALGDASAGEVEGEEGRVEDYRDRGGYQPDFLGVDVALPSVERDAGDILEFEFGGKTETELRYEHYSVVMNRPRRMCFFSAVNINGNLSKKSKRVGWKWDPRIPKSQQIMNECYGAPPRFSRGHMSRREDPAWGDEAAAKRGNEDSMHVTNTTPQMQAFNAPIWLALEDYALEHAREDGMNISVFTGPYFSEADPTMYGVRIPLSFWKIIAFLHDETGLLCATGYEMNQEASLLPEEEFVFGAFTSPQLGKATQVSIRSIAAKSGISFGDLAQFDPLDSGEEGREAVADQPLLLALEQVRFV